MTALKSRNNFGPLRLALIVAAASLLAGCESDGNTPGPLASLTSSKPAEPEKPAEPPMTRQRAAEE